MNPDINRYGSKIKDQACINLNMFLLNINIYYFVEKMSMQYTYILYTYSMLKK